MDSSLIRIERNFNPEFARFKFLTHSNLVHFFVQEQKILKNKIATTNKINVCWKILTQCNYVGMFFSGQISICHGIQPGYSRYEPRFGTGNTRFSSSRKKFRAAMRRTMLDVFALRLPKEIKQTSGTSVHIYFSFFFFLSFSFFSFSFYMVLLLDGCS